MEYEIYEPLQDEYYDQACRAAYAAMFNEGRTDVQLDRFCPDSPELYLWAQAG